MAWKKEDNPLCRLRTFPWVCSWKLDLLGRAYEVSPKDCFCFWSSLLRRGIKLLTSHRFHTSRLGFSESTSRAIFCFSCFNPSIHALLYNLPPYSERGEGHHRGKGKKGLVGAFFALLPWKYTIDSIILLPQKKLIHFLDIIISL